MRFVVLMLALFAAPLGTAAQEAIALAVQGWRTETREGVTSTAAPVRPAPRVPQ